MALSLNFFQATQYLNKASVSHCRVCLQEVFYVKCDENSVSLSPLFGGKPL